MINDCEFELFTKLATVLRTAFPGIYVTGEYVRTSPRFPCVSIEQRDSSVWRGSRETTNMEVHTSVMYEVNVYSNKESGKKAECKEILSVVDDELSKLNFTRTMLSPVPNLADATIYRLTARYQGIVGTDSNDEYIIYKQ